MEAEETDVDDFMTSSWKCIINGWFLKIKRDMHARGLNMLLQIRNEMFVKITKET